MKPAWLSIYLSSVAMCSSHKYHCNEVHDDPVKTTSVSLVVGIRAASHHTMFAIYQ